MLQACLVRCWYLAVTSKGLYGYGLSRSRRATWHVTTIRSSRLLVPVTNWEPHCVTLAGYCYAMRHGMKVQIVTQYRVNVMALWYMVTIQVCTHLNPLNAKLNPICHLLTILEAHPLTCNVTRLWYVIMLQVCTPLNIIFILTHSENHMRTFILQAYMSDVRKIWCSMLTLSTGLIKLLSNLNIAMRPCLSVTACLHSDV
jgi:hypothetical protein